MLTTINGEQVVIWPFAPQEDITEHNHWLTDIVSSYDGEQRISLRKQPRQVINYSHLATLEQLGLMKTYVKKWGANVFMTPLWFDTTIVGELTSAATTITLDTTESDYRDGGYVFVRDDDDNYEVVVIDTVDPGQINLSTGLINSYNRAWVMPAIRCRMPNTALDISRPAGQLANTSVQFHALDTVDLSAGATPYTVHAGYQVMEDRPILKNSISASIIWPQYVSDNGTGIIYTDESRAKSYESSMVSWDTICGYSAWTIRTWLHSMRGRWKAFWMPSYSADMTLAADILSADTSITINNVGYNTFYTTGEIMILLKNGTRYYRSVTASVDNGATETLTISAIGSDIASADVEMISIMTLSRLDADRIEIRHRSGKKATVQIPVIEVGE